MSFLMHCPHCGERDVTEFRYGGQMIPAVKTNGFSSNLPEAQHERWYHRLGCRRWLAAERDVRTNTVVRTSRLEEEVP